MTYSRDGQIHRGAFKPAGMLNHATVIHNYNWSLRVFFFYKGVMSLFSAEGGMVPGTRMKIASFIRTA